MNEFNRLSRHDDKIWVRLQIVTNKFWEKRVKIAFMEIWLTNNMQPKKQ